MDRGGEGPFSANWLIEQARLDDISARAQLDVELEEYYGPDEPDDVYEKFIDELSDDEYEKLFSKINQIDRHRLATPEQRRYAFDAQGGKCYYCAEKVLFNKFHADHLTPYSAGGRTSKANLVCSCRQCNLAKGNMSYHDFMMELGTKGLEWRDERYRAQAAYFYRRNNGLL